MAAVMDQYFFAGYRGYYTDGDTFLQIIGLGKINNQSYHVKESRLNERGIKLGDFLSATVPLGEPVKDFVLQKYKFKVNIDGNYAMVEDQEGDLEKSSDGVLVFKTKTFGAVRSLNQNIPLGKYRITIRATRQSEESLFKNMKYCAEVKEKVNETASSSSAASTANKVIVGDGFASAAPSSSSNRDGKRIMKAFVHNLMKKGDMTTYFLWICDNHENSIFASKTHILAVGHFFEGVFEEKMNAKSKWQCVKYVKGINALLEGSIVGNKIQLKIKTSRYEAADGTGFPTVYAEHFGTIIDNKKKLPVDYNGFITTQLCKVGSDFVWVVIDMI